MTAKVCLLAKKAGLNGSSLHTLRHSHGSQLLSAGVPLPAVSKRLGHSSVFVTATVYSHALSKDETAAAEVWDATVQKSSTRHGTRARFPEPERILAHTCTTPFKVALSYWMERKRIGSANGNRTRI